MFCLGCCSNVDVDYDDDDDGGGGGGDAVAAVGGGGGDDVVDVYGDDVCVYFSVLVYLFLKQNSFLCFFQARQQSKNVAVVILKSLLLFQRQGLVCCKSNSVVFSESSHDVSHILSYLSCTDQCCYYCCCRYHCR